MQPYMYYYYMYMYIVCSLTTECQKDYWRLQLSNLHKCVLVKALLFLNRTITNNIIITWQWWVELQVGPTYFQTTIRINNHFVSIGSSHTHPTGHAAN